ncbi:hypothetical protein ACFSKU_15885 [Pontibacter silvestris]|uniref:Uncharacterized protein n=1 Tax=Pontibacter silvestris TaxID=2305183 RepID=A0ABW4X313_9BACT|nr:hypothetical protein [Pontibacter silvestris]MCC9135950.1 hypothetical protein [Pontibacter silvestris]
MEEVRGQKGYASLGSAPDYEYFLGAGNDDMEQGSLRYGSGCMRGNDVQGRNGSCSQGTLAGSSGARVNSVNYKSLNIYSSRDNTFGRTGNQTETNS